MNPLDRIIAWWEPLEDFPRGWVACEVCSRITEYPTALISEQAESLFREYLSERIVVHRHVGRVIAVRAVIDWYFMRESSRDSMEFHLDAVETGDPQLKAMSNAAVARNLQSAAGRQLALDTWTALRAGDVSDDALVSWERDATLRSLLP